MDGITSVTSSQSTGAFQIARQAAQDTKANASKEVEIQQQQRNLEASRIEAAKAAGSSVGTRINTTA